MCRTSTIASKSPATPGLPVASFPPTSTLGPACPGPGGTARRSRRRSLVARRHRQAPTAKPSPTSPPARFTLAADAPAAGGPAGQQTGARGELLLHSLRGDERPKFGELLSTKHGPSSADGTSVKGRDQMLVYAVPAWPEEDFTVAVRVRIDEMPKSGLGQIFSAWAAGMDDPLRLAVQNGKLFARIEAGGNFGTPGVPIEVGHWHHVCAVKRGETLSLFLDGQPAGSCAAPRFTTTAAHDCALGGNPHFSWRRIPRRYLCRFRLLGARPLGRRVAAPRAPRVGQASRLPKPQPVPLGRQRDACLTRNCVPQRFGLRPSPRPLHPGTPRPDLRKAHPVQPGVPGESANSRARASDCRAA